MARKAKGNTELKEYDLMSQPGDITVLPKAKRYVPPEHLSCEASRPKNQRFASVVTVTRECCGTETIVTRYCTCGFCHPQSNTERRRPITHKDVEIIKHTC